MSDSFKPLSSQFTGLALSFGVTGNGVSIDPATGAVRIPTDALQDGLDVTVTASDSGGAAVGSFRLTVRADAPAATAPVLVAPPSLAGSGAIGSPLTVDPGRWDGRPAPELTLQWRRDGADIAGAVAASYLPAAADDRAELDCLVTARNAAGELAAVAGPLRAAWPAPVVTGTLGDLGLEAGTGTRSVDAAAAFAGEARRFAVSGAGASVDPLTGVVAIPTDAEVADAPVTVTASNSGGSATTGFRVTVTAPLAAPVAVGGIPDQILEQDSGPRTVSAQAAFRGEALGFALDAAPAGVGIDAGSGLVTIATDTAARRRAGDRAGEQRRRGGDAGLRGQRALDGHRRSTRANRLGELGFISDAAAPSCSQEAGFARLVPALTRRVHGDWKKALGDGRYRCLARWGGAAAADGQPAVLALGALPPGRAAIAFGVRADIFETASGQRQLQLRQYTGAGTATAVIAAAAVVGWAWDAWQWVELEIDGTMVRARVYPEAAAAPAWQIVGTTDQTAAGAFGPGGQPASGRSPVIDLRRLEVHPPSVQIPAIPAAPLDTRLGHCASHGADMKYSIVFKLKDALAAAVAVEWTDRADPRGSGDGWEPCVRLRNGDWRISSYGATDGRAAHWRDPGLFDNIGLRYRLAAAGPWSAVSEGRKAITIVAVAPAALAAADWTPLAPADAGGAIGAFALHGAAAGAGAVEWSRAGAADWQPCLDLGDGRWRPAATAGLAGEPLVLRYAFAAEGPWSPASPDARVLVTGLPFCRSGSRRPRSPAPAGSAPRSASIQGSGSATRCRRWRCSGAATASTFPAPPAPAFVPGPAEDGRELACAVTAKNLAGSVTAVTAALRVAYAPPVARGALLEEIFDEDSGPQTVDAAAGLHRREPELERRRRRRDDRRRRPRVDPDRHAARRARDRHRDELGRRRRQRLHGHGRGGGRAGNPADPDRRGLGARGGEPRGRHPHRRLHAVAGARGGRGAVARGRRRGYATEAELEPHYNPTVALGGDRWRHDSPAGKSVHLRANGTSLPHIRMRYRIAADGAWSSHSENRRTLDASLLPAEPPAAGVERHAVPDRCRGGRWASRAATRGRCGTG